MTVVALTAAFCALAISVLALLITIGAARRMRLGGSALTPALSGAALLPATGVGIPDFRVVDVDGTSVSHARLGSGRHAVAFVSTACDACRDSVPEFLDLAGTVGAEHALAVLLDDSDEPGTAVVMVDQLRQKSTVLVEDESRDVSRQFDVVTFPTFIGVEDGVVQVSSNRIADLVRWHRT